MDYVIANSFQKSLTKLDNRAQSQVNDTVYTFQQEGPDHPSLKFHRVKRAKEDNFWTARVNDDIRMVIYKGRDRFIFCYVDHHDAAYDWAERRTMKVHPKTGAAQLVKLVERTEEVVQKIYKQKIVEPRIFETYDKAYLHALGVPEQWLEPVRHATDSTLFKVLEQLPEEAAERLLNLAAGEPVPVPTTRTNEDPLEHPDAQRRFRVVEDEKELQQALQWPWEQWTTFLHPRQRGAVDGNYNGPALVTGGAGTGKTVVAMHRAKKLLKANPDVRVLFTTFSKTLAARLGESMNILLGEDGAARDAVEITNLHSLAFKIYSRNRPGRIDIVDDKVLKNYIEDARNACGITDFGTGFLFAEWEAIVDAWGIDEWTDYRDFQRTGRGSPLSARKRLKVWKVFEQLRTMLDSSGKMTWSSLSYECIDIVENDDGLRWDHVIVDEAQDFGPAELKLLRALARDGANDIFLVGDSGQQIYQRPFSWRAVGLEVVGRSTNLKVNYRTTEQIRRFADELMPEQLKGLSGSTIDHTSISLLKGADPEVHGFYAFEEERQFVAERIESWIERGLQPRDIAILGRTHGILNKRAIPALKSINAPNTRLKRNKADIPDAVSVGTMHGAKGLEFKAVIVMGCEQKQIPHPMALRACDSDAEREQTLETERNLLYVSATRAREEVVLTHVGEASELLGGEQD